MLRVLNKNEELHRYCDEVDNGKTTPGSILWPVEFDVL